ncbi:MAG: hypothetical protein ABIS01_00350 [Ferruginibacter sp.]
MNIANTINVIDPNKIKYVTSELSICKKNKSKSSHIGILLNKHLMTVKHYGVPGYFYKDNLQRQNEKSPQD